MPIKVKRLSTEIAIQLGGALAKVAELENLSIVTKESEAELRGLKSFINDTLHEYANDLLGAWFVVRQEYEPLVNGVSRLLFRASSLNAPQVSAPGDETASNPKP